MAFSSTLVTVTISTGVRILPRECEDHTYDSTLNSSPPSLCLNTQIYRNERSATPSPHPNNTPLFSTLNNEVKT